MVSHAFCKVPPFEFPRISLHLAGVFLRISMKSNRFCGGHPQDFNGCHHILQGSPQDCIRLPYTMQQSLPPLAFHWILVDFAGVALRISIDFLIYCQGPTEVFVGIPTPCKAHPQVFNRVPKILQWSPLKVQQNLNRFTHVMQGFSLGIYMDFFTFCKGPPQDSNEFLKFCKGPPSECQWIR